MTPEERWIKIENAIQSLVGSQAHHEAEQAENARQIARISEQMERMERKTSQIDTQIEKNTAAIRDLIVVSRTVAQQATEKHMVQMTPRLKLSLSC